MEVDIEGGCWPLVTVNAVFVHENHVHSASGRRIRVHKRLQSGFMYTFTQLRDRRIPTYYSTKRLV